MSAVAELINALIARGMEAAEAAALVARAGAEIGLGAPSKGAIRTRNWRKKLASQSVTERHRASHCDKSLLLTSSDYQLNNDQEKKERGPRKARASPLPAGWVVPARAKALAEELGVDLEPTVDRFRDYLASSGKLYADYDAGLCNFIRNTPKFNGAMKNGRPAWKNGREPSAITAALEQHSRDIASSFDECGETRPASPRLISHG